MSVRFEMRLPDEFAERLKVAASEAGLSRAAYITWALEAVSGRLDTSSRGVAAPATAESARPAQPRASEGLPEPLEPVDEAQEAYRAMLRMQRKGSRSM